MFFPGPNLTNFLQQILGTAFSNIIIIFTICSSVYLYILYSCLSLKNMDGTCKYCFVSSVGLKLGQFIINPPLMYTPHHLAKCQFASLSVCFLLLASDNSSLGAEEQYDSGVQAAFLGMVPPLSCVWHTTPQPATGCGYASLPKTTPTGAHSQLHTPGTDLQLATVGKYQLYPGRQTTVIDSHDYPKTCRNTHTQFWHEKELEVVLYFVTFYDLEG